MKTLTLTILLSLPLFADNISLADESFSYSGLVISDSLSLYAGKTDMEFFEKSDAYSVGVILQEDKESDMQFGLGYVQPCSKLDNLLVKETQDLYSQNADGIMFFMNYTY